MITSKNIFNYLNAIEVSFLFNNQYFFVIENSLDSTYDKNIKSNFFFKRQFIKPSFKICLTSSFFMLKNIKFPLSILFFIKSSLDEDYFFSFFSNNLTILLLKYRGQLLNLFDLDYSSLFHLKSNLLSLDTNNTFFFIIAILKI